MNNTDCFKLRSESVVTVAIQPRQGSRASSSVIRFKRFKSAVARVCVAIAIPVCALNAMNAAHADESRCSNINVQVYSADRSDVDTACEAAREAISFLRTNGLDTTRALEVYLVKTLPDMAHLSAYGCYDTSRHRVYMLFFSECIKQETWAGPQMDRALYKSLLVHEVAHAVAAANFTYTKPSMLAHEYVAYVTMFATMEPSKREHFLKRFSGHGFDSVDQMSMPFFLLDPFRFGTEAYRHFLKLDNQKTFLEDVLSGRVLIGKDGP